MFRVLREIHTMPAAPAPMITTFFLPSRRMLSDEPFAIWITRKGGNQHLLLELRLRRLKGEDPKRFRILGIYRR